MGLSVTASRIPPDTELDNQTNDANVKLGWLILLMNDTIF